MYPNLPGDVNGDDVVNGLHISLVSSYWLRTGQGLAGDANHDGVVNGLDIALISSNWLETLPGNGAARVVPEPAKIVLSVLGGLAIIVRGRRLA